MIKNPSNLLNLQNLIKRDPISYHDEYLQQHRHFLANLHIFQMESSAQSASTPLASSLPSSSTTHSTTSAPPKHHKDFGNLITFLSHVSPCYPTESAQFPQQLLTLLTKYYDILDTALRCTIIRALILLQNRGMISRLTLLPTLFQMFKIQDKQLRALLFSHIVNDIKRMNLKKIPGYLKLNTQLQNYMYTLLSDTSSPLIAQKSCDVLIDLWRRKIWHDEKTVHILQNACFSKDHKLKTACLRFFLGVTLYEEEEQEEEEEEKANIRAKMTFAKSSIKGVTKKKKKKMREIERANKKVNREDTQKAGHSSVIDHCPALMLIHDPQVFADRLFSALKASTDSFQTRMLMMNVISRLVGAHQLLILNFYPFLQKYLQPHQRNVTHILTYLAQASHPMLPPDVLRPCIMTLANHFVTDRSSAEVTAVGLNAIREICARAPLVMEKDLLNDLVQYKKSKSKGVMMAARSLIALFRDINPSLLQRKERGKFAEMDGNVEYGDIQAKVDIAGADLLQQIVNPLNDKENADDEDAWNMEVNGSDSEEAEEEEEEHATSAEINRFLKSLENNEDEPMNEEESKEGEQTTSKLDNNKGKKRKAEVLEEQPEQDDDEDEAEDDEDMELEEGEDEEGEEGEDEDEEGEHGEDDEDEDGEDMENGDEEGEDDEKASGPAAKKRKTSDNTAVTTSTAPAAPVATTSDGKPLPFGATRIFTPRDFENLRQARLEAAKDPSKRKNKDKPEQYERKDKVGEAVDEDAIKGWQSKKRLSKEERLASVLEGRSGGRNSREKGGGTTNKDKLKAKPFMLVKHKQSIQLKKQRSFAEQQATHSGHIKNMKSAGKKIKNKMKKRKSAGNK